jgi:hypothetical protein
MENGHRVIVVQAYRPSIACMSIVFSAVLQLQLVAVLSTG